MKKETQEQKVLRLVNEMQLFSIAKLLKHFDHTPKNSIEKVVHALEKQNLVSKTRTKVMGMYGREETLYTIL